MNETPDVSVIIPTRGRPDLLQRAISGALQQTWRNLEVIVVLDGEDGATGEAISHIHDVRLRLIILEKPVGGAEARNIGAKEAKGRYIALLDDDDEWLPVKLERQLKLANTTNAKVFVVVTQYLYRVAGKEDEVWPGHLPKRKEPLSEFLFSSRGGFQTSTYLCPRDLFISFPFTKGLKKHQDWDWFLQLASLPDFQLLVVPEPLSIYWTPPSTRASVSGSMDWKFSSEWAKSRLSLMTRKAYSSFIVKICVRSAGTQKNSLAALRHLLRELIIVGCPTPLLLGEFAVAAFMPESLRCRLRSGLVYLRKLQPSM